MLMRNLCLALLVLVVLLELASAHKQNSVKPVKTTKKPKLNNQEAVFRLEIVDHGRCPRKMPFIADRKPRHHHKQVYVCRPYHHKPTAKTIRQIRVDTDLNGKRVFDLTFDKIYRPTPQRPTTFRPENIMDVNKKVDFNLQSVAEAVLSQNSEVN